MAELTPTDTLDTTDTRDTTDTTDTRDARDPVEIERALRARIAELEALVDARTQAIVGMGARLAELQGDAPPALSARVRAAEEQLAHLRATKVIRYSELPRRLYGRLLRVRRG